MSGIGVASVAVCLLPLGAAVANGLNGLTGERLYGHVGVARVAVTTVFASLAASLYVAVAMVAQPGALEVTIYRFIQSGDLEVGFGFLIDPLSVVMMLVVTGISALVTRFSVNYMHNEPGFTRFFTIVSLFVFAMLVLVMADNYLVMFLGWEGVGICSYLLIGFYRERPASARAGTRAFIMNRVGDADLLIAMFLLVASTGTLNYGEVFAQVSSLPRGVVETLGFLLLLGAAGKSAQLPLGTWLARAMEGPTPSSALFYGATMVTAGVYLVVRSSPLFDAAPTALLAVGLVGALTALYSQLVGYVQTDIKGMLASSTTAQMGLMFVFCGLGLYAVAIFHLVAHAFYKSYLFLTAPSILHHLHGGPDPTAVRRPTDTARLPAAAALAVAAALLAAPLIGRVLQPAGDFTSSLWVVLALAVIATFAAVFSARRMTAVAFAGHAGEPHADESHASDDGHGADDHRSPTAGQASRPLTARLVAPLAALAGLVALGLALDVLPGGLDGSWFQRLLGQGAAGSGGVGLGNPLLATVFAASMALLLLSGWYGPRYLDRFREELPASASPAIARRLYWWGLNRGYLDDFYDRALVAPTKRLGWALQRLDTAVLDRSASAAAPLNRSGEHQATWEARFLALTGAPAGGGTALDAPREGLDWLLTDASAPVEEGVDHPQVAVPRVDAAARSAAWLKRISERAQRDAEGEGLFSGVADAFAALAEGLERVVFQSADTGALKLAGVIAAFTDAVERAVFQSGVERGVTNTAAGTQRMLLAVERRMGQPMVIGAILAVALLTLIVGTR